ncbi:hypothetical protein [Leptospira idonii]|uniref:hypothetical protein n=1 Tax=Leptospira idonii TaxID=1193500 RepID=UPI0014385EED|nr:hypothetical protein [Leptospira idonii]
MSDGEARIVFAKESNFHEFRFQALTLWGQEFIIKVPSTAARSLTICIPTFHL